MTNLEVESIISFRKRLIDMFKNNLKKDYPASLLLTESFAALYAENSENQSAENLVYAAPLLQAGEALKIYACKQGSYNCRTHTTNCDDFEMAA